LRVEHEELEHLPRHHRGRALLQELRHQAEAPKPQVRGGAQRAKLPKAQKAVLVLTTELRAG
jgi:hypothetical protein